MTPFADYRTKRRRKVSHFMFYLTVKNGTTALTSPQGPLLLGYGKPFFERYNKGNVEYSLKKISKKDYNSVDDYLHRITEQTRDTGEQLTTQVANIAKMEERLNNMPTEKHNFSVAVLTAVHERQRSSNRSPYFQ